MSVDATLTAASALLVLAPGPSPSPPPPLKETCCSSIPVSKAASDVPLLSPSTSTMLKKEIDSITPTAPPNKRVISEEHEDKMAVGESRIQDRNNEERIWIDASHSSITLGPLIPDNDCVHQVYMEIASHAETALIGSSLLTATGTTTRPLVDVAKATVSEPQPGTDAATGLDPDSIAEPGSNASAKRKSPYQERSRRKSTQHRRRASPTKKKAVKGERNPPDAAATAASASPTRKVSRRGRSDTASQSSRPRPPLHCRVHTPTLAELQSMSFTDYIRQVVLPAASCYESDDNSIEEEGESSRPNENQPSKKKTSRDVVGDEETAMELKEGLAKVSLPTGFWKEVGIGYDRTARGPNWDDGTDLGDLTIPHPIQQYVRGLAGLYEYTFYDSQGLTVAQFRTKADTYRVQQLGAATWDDGDDERDEGEGEEGDQKNENSDKDDSDDFEELERLARLERQFWKRLGPTMPPATYGADMEGTLFGNDPASGWSLAQLDSCLHVLASNIPGVTSPYLYFGMWASVFCAHTEDMNLFSINYLHAGQPKFWYAVAEPDTPRFLTLAQFHYSQQAATCKEFLRHKRCLISPSVLKKAGIRYQVAIQYPGEAMITFPGSVHFGFNLGFNVAEATNFAVPEWIPFGRKAKVCLCRPDSVRIDMDKMAALLQRYHSDIEYMQRHLQQHSYGTRKAVPLSWKEWRRQKDLEKEQRKEEEKEAAASSKQLEHQVKNKRKENLSAQQRKNEFWVEVVPAMSTNGKLYVRKKKTLSTNGKKQNGRRTIGSASSELATEEWRLAKPLSRKRTKPQTRVLCILPATSEAGSQSVENDDEEDEEQCFAGQIVEINEDHVRVRLDGLPKSEDVWMPSDSDKLFLDGGLWNETHEEAGIPALHYWQEMDSKRRCLEE